jgi:hypothetical protein
MAASCAARFRPPPPGICFKGRPHPDGRRVIGVTGPVFDRSQLRPAATVIGRIGFSGFFISPGHTGHTGHSWRMRLHKLLIGIEKVESPTVTGQSLDRSLLRGDRSLLPPKGVSPKAVSLPNCDHCDHCDR